MATVFPEDPWLAAFHGGDRSVMERCYRDHYRTVATAVRRILTDADAETVTHEVFYRLLSDRGMRESFQGGNLAAWLTRVAMNGALDHRRRYRREANGSPENATADADPGTAERADDDLAAKQLVDRFRRECLPPEWDALFDARFLRALPQRLAAKELGMHRTTLVYREARIRALLRKFLIRTERA
ncbi:MAG TPA: RNA polymerase sigma factor [Gemmatimonadales bacterium]|nr:RNA polymerase sigma factor [Gemmatimonadales bacterium]